MAHLRGRHPAQLRQTPALPHPWGSLAVRDYVALGCFTADVIGLPMDPVVLSGYRSSSVAHWRQGLS
ncbi:hypothetical protein ABG768_011732, partial [Culter alburnus]